MTMRPVYVKFEEQHHRILKQKARDEGCSISDLIRRAAIRVFYLPTSGDFFAESGEDNDDLPSLASRDDLGVAEASGDEPVT